MNAYLFFKITGHDKEKVWERSLFLENYALKHGYNPINPLRLHGINSLYELQQEHKKNKKHKHYLIEDIKVLIDCEVAIGNPKDALISKGVNIELFLCKELDIEIIEA